MPIQLTTTWKSGSQGGEAEYAEVKLTSFRIGVEHNKNIDIGCEAGDTVDGEWVSGVNGRFKISLRDDIVGEAETSEYTDFLQANGATLRALQTAIYEAVQAKKSRLAGTIT